MLRFVLLYLVFANAYEHFTLFKKAGKTSSSLSNLLSNLAALSIMLQLCLAYFCSGIIKLHDPLWRNGEAVYYALFLERFRGTSINLWLAHQNWLTVPANYAILLFELAFPFLIWCKKLRKYLLPAGLLLHLLLYVFLMIYGFQLVFILVYGLFISEKQWEKTFQLGIKNQE